MEEDTQVIVALCICIAVVDTPLSSNTMELFSREYTLRVRGFPDLSNTKSLLYCS